MTVHPRLPGIEIADDAAILEVGSGGERLFRHSLTLDSSPVGDPDVRHDLNDVPYPFPDDSFDLVVCLHVLEHVRGLVEATTELHRVLKPGGILFVEAPYFTSHHFYRDPTHVHAFTTGSFDYYVEGEPVSRFGYSPARFEKVNVEIVVPGNGWWRSLVRGWLNRHHHLYEERLAWIFPRHTIRFTLRKFP